MRRLFTAALMVLSTAALGAPGGDRAGDAGAPGIRNASYTIAGTSITFYSRSLRDADMEILDTHPEITSILFSETFVGSIQLPGGIADNGNIAFSISDKGLAHLANVTHLESLTLDSRYKMVNLSDGVDALKGLKLKSVSLGKTKFTAKGLQALAGIDTITSFSAEACAAPDVIDVATHWPHLRVLAATARVSFIRGDHSGPGDANQAGDKDLAKLTKLADLEELYVDAGTALNTGRSRLTDDCTTTLVKLTKLKVLHVQASGITDAGVEKLAKLRDLEELNINGTPITNAAMKTIGGFQKLKVLMISDTDITDTGLLSLPAMPNLADLHFQHTAISDKGLDNLERFPKLKTVDTLGSKVDLEFVRDKGLGGRRGG